MSILRLSALFQDLGLSRSQTYKFQASSAEGHEYVSLTPIREKCLTSQLIRSATFRNTPIDLILYDSLLSLKSAKSFLTGLCISHLLRASLLDTTKAAPDWRTIAHGRPEIDYLCVTMMELHNMSLAERHLQPFHVGVVVEGLNLTPDYKHPPPDGRPRSTSPTLPDRETRRRPRPALNRADSVEPHASLFIWTSHIYFVDNMPPNIVSLRPYLGFVTHFSFAYRRDYGLQFPELSAVLRAVLAIPWIAVVLVMEKRTSLNPEIQGSKAIPGYLESGVTSPRAFWMMSSTRSGRWRKIWHSQWSRRPFTAVFGVLVYLSSAKSGSRFGGTVDVGVHYIVDDIPRSGSQWLARGAIKYDTHTTSSLAPASQPVRDEPGIYPVDDVQ
ncbi:hypothetical protein B0H10DRAFT_1938701 [Mycena sp. CBHHK59/15]|nr:hypothetical protein B0H10DRAFT_1938701 [Mycena sp. CBHHK59/15]